MRLRLGGVLAGAPKGRTSPTPSRWASNSAERGSPRHKVVRVKGPPPEDASAGSADAGPAAQERMRRETAGLIASSTDRHRPRNRALVAFLQAQAAEGRTATLAGANPVVASGPSSPRCNLLVALVVAGTSLLACSRNQAPARGQTHGAARPRVPDTPALDAYFRAHSPADAPGRGPHRQARGRLLGRYGLADLGTRAPITTRTLFNLGSLSKTFVANAILILQEHHQLSVDDPLSTYFPGFKHPEIAARVTLRHLLTHTSGLPTSGRSRPSATST